MPEPEEGAGSRDGPPGDESTVQPLERNAPIYVERSSGYVDIRQVQGDPTLYTPAEARDIAEEILAAAEACERGADPPDESRDAEPE
jgi:hypothetical protein